MAFTSRRPDEFTLSLQRGENIEKCRHRRNRSGAGHGSPRTSRRSTANPAKRRGVVAAPQARPRTRTVRISRRRPSPLRGLWVRRPTFPGRRRLLEGHRVIHRDILETRLVAGVLQQFEQHQPGVARLRLSRALRAATDVGERRTLTSLTCRSAQPRSRPRQTAQPASSTRTLATSMRTLRCGARCGRAGRTGARRCRELPLRLTSGARCPPPCPPPGQVFPGRRRALEAGGVIEHARDSKRWRSPPRR